MRVGTGKAKGHVDYWPVGAVDDPEFNVAVRLVNKPSNNLSSLC